MKVKPHWLRKLQEFSSVAVSQVSEKVTEASDYIGARAKELDDSCGISSGIAQAANTLDSEYQLHMKITSAGNHVGKGLNEFQQSESYKSAMKKASQTGRFLKENITCPVECYLEESGLQRHYHQVKDKAIDIYGAGRGFLKPYFAPETLRELLEITKAELLYLNACILQVSRGEAEKLANSFGAAVASRVAGAASAAAVLGMVSTFGTAGTGTAIASLSGAAATNASLAWVGGLVGGGMTAGAVVTGGLALVVGMGTYRLLSSEARSFETLSDVEKRIVESTGFLVAAINDILNDDSKQLGYHDADYLLTNTLRPMHQLILEHADKIAANLDGKNSIAFRHHALTDFKQNVLHGFEFFLAQEQVNRRKRHPEFAIAGVLYGLLTETAIDDSRESQLVLDALRRMRGDWNYASEAELGVALSSYDADQIRGVANNVKGIYHEMLFVDDYNRTHQDSYAEIFEATNHAGADVMIRSAQTHEVIAEYQLKAGSSDQIIREHFEKYPDIDVLATEEIARQYGLDGSSGFSNEEITGQVNSVITDVVDNTLASRVEDSAVLAGLVAAGMEAKAVILGRRAVGEAGINVIKSSGIAAGSTALVAYLFG